MTWGVGVIQVSRTNSNDSIFAGVVMETTNHLYIWMLPWSVSPIFERHFCGGEQFNEL